MNDNDFSGEGMRSHFNRDASEPPVLSRRSLVVAGFAAVGTLGFWARSSASQSGGAAQSGPSTTLAEEIRLAAQSLSGPAAGSEESETSFTPISSNLEHGSSGPEISALQTRLREIGFDPGPIDGDFGESTLRSVWGYEKLVLGTSLEEMQGVVTPEIWQRINQPTGVTARRSPGGMHLEIYLPEQTAVLFIDGAVRLISHISSGSEVEWCDEVLIDLDDGTQVTKGICGDSVTPGGVYHFERKVDGWRNGKLGRLYKPTYFNYGIAIHGAGNVPPYRASHGCVRFPMHIAEYLQDLVSIGDTVYVFDGVEEPEVYGAQSMTFDWPDPDWTPPSTTSTTTSTTTPPSTTAAPTTTHPPTPSTSAPPTTAPPEVATTTPATTAAPAVASATTTIPPAATG